MSMRLMEQPVDGGAAIKFHGLRHFSQAVAQEVRDPLQPVLDGVLVQIQYLRRSGNAAVTIQ